MTRKVFLVDLDRCVGCRACEIACEDENDLPAGGHRVSIVRVETGAGSRLYVPSFVLEGGVAGCTLCPQLQAEGRRPACVANCLTNALSFSEEGESQRAAGGIVNRFLLKRRVASVLYASIKDLGVLEKKTLSGK